MIATGGGAFMDAETRALILARCTAIWLDAEVETLAERVGRRGRRPLLEGKDPLVLLQRLAEVRNPVYAEAHLTIRSGALPHERRWSIRIVDGAGGRDDPDRRRPDRQRPRFPRASCSWSPTSNVEAAGWPRPARRGFRRALRAGAGEAQQELATVEALLDAMLEAGLGRGDHVVAVGGGVVGDVAASPPPSSSAAATGSRCRPACSPRPMPRSAARPAINARQGKNLIGAFHPPALVLIDPDALATLPARELRAGYAEVVKYGLIADPDFFAWCEANGAALLAGDRGGAAPRDRDLRRAPRRRSSPATSATRRAGAPCSISATASAMRSRRRPALLHGEAVAIGMAMAFELSVERGLCPPEDAARAIAHLAAVGLPVSTGRRAGAGSRRGWRTTRKAARWS